MSLVSTTVPNLINGVSQQPFALRLASQCEEQVNGFSSPVDGLRKRAGSRHIARLLGASGNAFIHTINRDPTEQYVVMIQNGDLKVWDLEGNPQSVSFPNGKSYLNGTSGVFKAVTVADFTFILNTSVITRKATDKSSQRPFEALVWVKQGSYGARYTIRVGGESHTYTVPNGSEASHANQVTTDNIATQLRSGILNKLGSGWQVDRIGSTLYIRRDDGNSFTVWSDDSIGDNGIEVITGRIQRFSNLPARAVNGFLVEVTGDQSSSFDNYYVRYNTSGTSSRGGVWEESLKGGEEFQFNTSTMPHALVRESDGTFTFRVLDWEERKVGDLDSNPFPSFIDRRLNDIFFHRNRLGFVSDENIVFSKAGDYFNFFIGTATAVLDDDPIDVGISHTKVSIIRHAIPFNKTLLLFSDQTQFQLGSAEILTPDTISVNQTTEYECSLRAKPVGAGRFIYFVTNRGSYSGVREYFVDNNTEAEEATDITGHVPQYLPNGVFKLAISSSEDTLVALSDQNPNRLYVYKYYWGEGEKLQASWSYWEFDKEDKILNCDFIESRLYVLVERPDGVHLEFIDIEAGAKDEGFDFHVHLDRLVDQNKVTINYNEGDPNVFGDRETLVTLPYKLRANEEIQIVTGKGGSRASGVIFNGFTRDDSNPNHTTLVLEGDWRTQPFFIGRPYTFRYVFSQLNIKEEAIGGGQMTIGEGRIQLRKVNLLFNNTGFFKTIVTPNRRDPYVYTFSGRVVGSGANILGQVSIEEGKFGFPVGSKNDQVQIEIINDTYLPCYFLSAEWEAFFSIRSRRL